MVEMALGARTTIKAVQPKDNLAIEIAMVEVQYCKLLSPRYNQWNMTDTERKFS